MIMQNLIHLSALLPLLFSVHADVVGHFEVCDLFTAFSETSNITFKYCVRHSLIEDSVLMFCPRMCQNA